MSTPAHRHTEEWEREQQAVASPSHDDRGYGDEHRGRATQDGAERFGGVKAGSAFFGWLCAMGMAVLLTAIAAAAGAAVGLSTGTGAGEAADEAVRDPGSIGLVGALVIAVILFVSYYCGGYVAGRMARFDGARQGVAVWAWAVAVAIAVGVVVAMAGDQYDVLGQLNGFPRIPGSASDLTTAGVVAVVVALVTSLVGALVGGVAGMRYHRRVDRATVVGVNDGY